MLLGSPGEVPLPHDGSKPTSAASTDPADPAIEAYQRSAERYAKKSKAAPEQSHFEPRLRDNRTR